MFLNKKTIDMNIKKTILIIVITAALTVFVTKNYFGNNSKTDSPSISAMLKKQNDSLVSANKDFANLVTVSVEDSTFLQFCSIPENVKVAWWEYRQAQYVIDTEYEEVEAQQAALKKSKMEKAQQEQKVQNEQADKDYNKIEHMAQKDFAKNSKDFLRITANPENIERFFLYLGSDDGYWSFNVTFDFNKKGDEKMPEGFKKMLEICKQADSVKNEVKKITNQIFETKKELIEKEYEEATARSMKMAAAKRNNAYMVYLLKIK